MAPLQEGESGLCSPWKRDEGSVDSPDGAVNNPARSPLADSSCFGVSGVSHAALQT